MEEKTVWDQFLDALYPPDVTCFACEKEAELNGAGLCEACAEEIRFAGVLTPRQGLNGLYAAFVYDEVLYGAVHRLKYSDARHLARNFAVCMRLPGDWKFDAITPVPLHEKRERQRGYNQSLLLAKELSKRYRIPVEPHLLRRIVDTEPQQKLSREEREKNVRGAFAASPLATGKSILLVDDVVTTGSTLMACAAALKSVRPARVYAACACTALY
ncbi:MAG TPA: ComF family protein, partial [Feifaniaceae bacterium]|nr:ComF family protein [Feifaniaceae bacterium]